MCRTQQINVGHIARNTLILCDAFRVLVGPAGLEPATKAL
jgi:hypothetical protein